MDEVDAMTADVAPIAKESAPSSSSRHRLRDRDALDGLESMGSGPPVSPVEPVSMLDPKGGNREVPWHGRALEVDCLVPARRWRRGRPGRGGRDDRARTDGAGQGVGGRGGDRGRPGGRNDELLRPRRVHGGWDEAPFV